MSLSLLGSICDKICKSCSWVCNCNRNNIVIIGDASPEKMAAIKALLQDRNLEQATRLAFQMRAQVQPIQIRLMALPTGDDVEEHQDRILIAIFDVAFRCIERSTDHKQGW